MFVYGMVNPSKERSKLIQKHEAAFFSHLFYFTEKKIQKFKATAITVETSDKQKEIRDHIVYARTHRKYIYT